MTDPELFQEAEYADAKRSVHKVDHAEGVLRALVLFLAALFMVAVGVLIYLGLETKQDTTEAVDEVKQLVADLKDVAEHSRDISATNKKILDKIIDIEEVRVQAEKNRGPIIAQAINDINTAIANGLSAHDQNVAERLDQLLRARRTAAPQRRPISPTRVSPNRPLTSPERTQARASAPAPAPPPPPPTTTTTCPKRGKSGKCR